MNPISTDVPSPNISIASSESVLYIVASNRGR